MAGSSVAALALLCPKCGKMQMYDISRFTIKHLLDSRRKLNCSCGQEQASLVSVSRWQYLFKVFCVVCEKEHLISLDSKKLWQPGAVKIYCADSRMELGMAGSGQAIADALTCQKNAAFALAREISKPNDTNDISDEIENPSIMLEILNKIHDIAEQDSLYCGCGSTNVRINLLENAIELICIKCDGRRILPAKSEADRSQAEKLAAIELTPLVLCKV